MAARIKKPKVQLVRFNREELFDEYFEDMNCLACVSTFESFQFIHTLNMLLDRNFRLDLEMINDKGGVAYKIYNDVDTIRSIDYNVICNRNRTDYLIPELLNSDFLLLMNGMKSHPDLLENITTLLKSEKRISYSYVFEPLKLKSKEYLVL